jgi:enamine deaminase RidA (YjgF/YER057c/UK114 family)
VTSPGDSIVRLGSGGPYEAAIGYSRVVAANGFALTAGCTAVIEGVVAHLGDAGGQAGVALSNALAALERVGAGPQDVVQSRMYITDRADADAVGAAHGAVFGAIRPAATMVLVAGLIDPAMLVEIELVAVLPGAR